MKKIVEIVGNKIEYIEFGNGDTPFVIIPGLGARSTLAFEDAIKGQYAKLLNDFRIYLIERPLSLNDDDNVSTIAEAYYQAMVNIGIDNPIVIGNSMGGMIGLEIALNHKDYISKLILASSVARVDDYSKNLFKNWYRLSLGDVSEYNKQMVNDIYSRDSIEKYGDALITPYNDLTKEELDRFRIQCKSLYDFDLYDNLSSIITPIYFIGSSHDDVFKIDRYNELKPFTKGFYMYDGYSHMVCDEAPDFLDNVLKIVK